ncbi:MAG TPA: DMT family transporter [Steroidobacter sp.]
MSTPGCVAAANPALSRPTLLSRWLTPLELTALGAIWGASFLFMRVAAPELGPFALVEVRLALGALILLPFLWQARTQFTRSHWLRLAGISAINSAIPFALFAWAAERAPAGIGAICNATAVMFTALIAYALYGERIGRRRAMGLLAGFVGVVVLASGKTGGASVAGAAIAGTVASALYGLGANLIRRYLRDLPTAAVAAATLVCASLLLAPFAVASWPSTPVRPVAWGSAALLGVLCTGFAFWLYYRLIHRIGAPRAATVTYLVPLFGVMWAWVVLGEPLTSSMGLAWALILGGVALSQRQQG